MAMPTRLDEVTTIEQLLALPDDFVYRREPGRRPRAWRDVGVPVLAIEFLSPTTAARDRGAKRRIYQRAGVAEYWIVDLDARLLEQWRPDDIRPEILDERLEWAPPELPTPVTLDLPALFTKAVGAP